jgi:putative transposase
MSRRANPNRQLQHILRSPSLLRQLLNPLQTAIRTVISEEKETSWFPRLPVLVHLLAGVYFHVAQMRSLREVISVLDINQTKAAIKGKNPKRSTFSDANNSARRLRVIRDVFSTLVASSQCRPRRWKGLQRLAALDSTLLHCVASAKWADYRENVNACKGHVLFDLARSAPRKLVLSTGRTHDRKAVSAFLEPGWTYIVDRAYNDYGLFTQMTRLGAFVVTRAKKGSVYRTIKKHHVSRACRKAGVLGDRTILLGQGPTLMTVPTRLVQYRSEDGHIYDFLTNRFDLSARTVADLYHARWGIEIFFKWLKRTLRMERPLGRSEEAYEIHALMALLTDILLKLLCKLPAYKRHISVTILRVIRENLFSPPTRSLLDDITHRARN